MLLTRIYKPTTSMETWLSEKRNTTMQPAVTAAAAAAVALT